MELGAFKNVKFHKNVFLNVQLGVGLNDQEGYKISNQVLLLTFYCSFRFRLEVAGGSR